MYTVHSDGNLNSFRFLMFHFLSTHYTVKSPILCCTLTHFASLSFLKRTSKKFTVDFCDCFFLSFCFTAVSYLFVQLTMMTVVILISFSIEKSCNHVKDSHTNQKWIHKTVTSFFNIRKPKTFRTFSLSEHSTHWSYKFLKQKPGCS